jgi:D-galactarolactone isomerase
VSSDWGQNSADSKAPRLKAPANACDCHIHIIDARFRAADPSATSPQNMAMEDYLVLQRRIGTTRAVVVQAKYFGIDNTCTLDAVARLGANGRGVAVVHPSVTDAELRRLDAGGIRGLRFSVWNPNDTVTRIEMIEPLSRRVNELGWHVQLHMSGDQIAENAALLRRLVSSIVIDHMARLPPQLGVAHPAIAIICDLLDRGRTWMKLSGAYLNTISGPPDYTDVTSVARAFVKAAPERMVWGSDWPHTTESHKPDDAVLFDLLAEWAPDETTRNRILVDNPATLYGFAN